MPYILAGSTIRAPHEISESNSTQVAQNRTLSGSVTRDYFGSNKRVWMLEYRNVQLADYTTLKAIYDSYLANAVAKTWEITETNYTVAQTNVHLDLREREFRVRGQDYLSDYTLILTEA